MHTAVLAAVLGLLIGVAAGLNNGVGLTPPLGWSTWCGDGPCGRDYCTETEVKEAATAMAGNGLFAAGYRWVLLDDCWAATHRTTSGGITWDATRFPSGIPSLVQWLHGRGFKFGLYTSAGNQTCSSGGRPLPVPGSEGRYQEDSNTFAAWGVDYVKVDWCGDVHDMPLDGIMVGAKDYRNFSHALTHTNPPRAMYFEGVAAYIFLLGDVGTYVNSWRASTDHHDKWSNTMEVIATVEFLGHQGGPGAWSYMDVLMTGGQGCRDNVPLSHCPGQTDDEYRTEFTMWALTQSPLVVATDVRNMTGIMQEVLLNRLVLRMHQNTATPPGRFYAGDSECVLGFVMCQLWGRVLQDGSVWAVLFNAGSAPTKIAFSFGALAPHLPPGWGANTTVTATDIWRNTTRVTTGAYSAVVAPHGVSSVVLKPQ